MDVNPYESPQSAEETKAIRASGTAELFTIYRAAILSLCFITVVMSLLLWNIPSRYIVNPHLYAYAYLLTILSVPLLSLRVLYLLICGRFRQAAIDAVLTAGAFLAFICAAILFPVIV